MEKENKKIKNIYILGAGASAKALPVINEMPNRLKMYFAFLLSYISTMNTLQKSHHKPYHLHTNIIERIY